ncbi:MAG TPA: type II toxin-antitoxin system RelE/ParE family toxin [Acetobacteraceae bacterium]|nr:type II toxin-antitoxin system RelE/ParE family toxin [Acetobacteraceae bacterium]
MAACRLSASAEADIIGLLAYTQDRFGETARRRYEALLVTALRDVASDPKRAGSIARPELGAGARSYHLRHSRDRASMPLGPVRRPRHLLVYRVRPPDLVEIGRVLHDAMEIERHLGDEFGGA